MQKNVASQTWIVFAFDETDNTAKTGDAANITGNLRIDGAAANAIDDTNPTELEDGYYIFDITAAESNGDNIVICPASTTSNIQVVGVPGALYTRPPNFEALSIETDGDLTKVNTLDGHTAQTADHTAGIADVPTVSEFNARTLASADYVLTSDTIAGATLVTTTTNLTNSVDANMISISGDTTAADNLEATYDGTGYSDPFAPAQQQQVTNLTIGSSGISTVATTAVVTTGGETNTYTSTQERDGTYHQITDSGGTTDMYYEFNVNATGVPSSVTMYGRMFSSNDHMEIFGYNWVGTSWEQIGDITGINTTVDSEITASMYNTHVGTGVNAGKVRVRFQSTGLTSSVLYIDQLYVSYAVVSSSVGYANGAIWVDTLHGTAGTTEGVNGVADLPVLTWADALSLATITGLNNFEIANGSSIVLSANSDNFTLSGANWSLDLNGQSIVNVSGTGAEVFGTSTGSNYEFHNCEIGNGTGVGVTADAGFYLTCAMAKDFTIGSAGTYYFDQCFSGVAGTGTPVLDFGVGAGSTNVNFRHYSGGIEIKNMGQSGTDTMSLEGWGQYVLNANCTGGSLAVRGHFKKTDNSGVVAVSDDANFKTSIIHFGMAQSSGTGDNQIQLDTTASAVNGSYDPSLVFIVAGTGAGQTRLILEYNGSTKTATVDRNWKVAPDATSDYRIMAHPGREHVNEGLAQAGANNTITLNTLASALDDAYNGQSVFLRSGTGEDQVKIVLDYDGATKIATVESNWGINPDSTTGYVILPLTTHTLSQINAEMDTALADYDGPTNAEMVARTIPSADYVVTSDTIAGVTLVATTTDVTNQVSADVTAISGDATSANNLELDYDGTGYAKANSTIGTTTTNTDMRGTDNAATAIGLAAHDVKLDTVDTNVDAILIDTGTTIPADIATAQADLDIITGTNGVNITDNAISAVKYDGASAFPIINADSGATEIARTGADSDTLETISDQIDLTATASALATVDTNVDAILVDTNELQTDWANGGRLDTIVDAILVDTNELQTDWVNGGRLDLILDAVLADTNELQTDWVNGGRLDLILDSVLEDTGTSIPALIAALENLSAAGVNAEVVDVLKTDTVSEMAQGAPPVAPTMEEILNYIYRVLRNKMETTATEVAVYDDAGTSKLIKSTISDDNTTFTKGEYGSGA